MERGEVGPRKGKPVGGGKKGEEGGLNIKIPKSL